MDHTTDSPNLTRMQNKVKNTINEWSTYANISFSFVQEGTPQIRIAFDPNGGSWSYVGKENTSIAADKPTMNLGWLDGSSDTITDDEHGVILHEFGHAIGLLHEHQSPLRGDKITLKEDGSYCSLSRLVSSAHLTFIFLKPSSSSTQPVKDGPRRRSKIKLLGFSTSRKSVTFLKST
jgi:hypothetical protein